jgi:hypothetical protein
VFLSRRGGRGVGTGDKKSKCAPGQRGRPTNCPAGAGLGGPHSPADARGARPAGAMDADEAPEQGWNDLLTGNRAEYRVRGRAMRAAHRALVLRSSARDASALTVDLQRYDLLNAPREAWRRQCARMHRLRLQNPRATLCVTVTAWLVSFLVCVCVLYLLSRDFVASKRSELYSSRRAYRKVLPLPSITVCQPYVDVPAFPRVAGGRRGVPIFSVRSFMRQGEGRALEADPDFALQPSYVGPSEPGCEKTLSRLDTAHFLSRSGGTFEHGTNRKACKACFQLGGQRKLNLHDAPPGQSLPLGAATRFRVHVESSVAALACRDYPRVPPVEHIPAIVHRRNHCWRRD